jgi:prevent-host-death family protein
VEILMDTETIANVQRAVLTRSGPQLAAALAETIGKGHERLTVRYAKDRLSAVLKRARSGEPQLIGENPDEQTVIISVADLAALCQASANTLTLRGSAGAGRVPAPTDAGDRSAGEPATAAPPRKADDPSTIS